MLAMEDEEVYSSKNRSAHACGRICEASRITNFDPNSGGKPQNLSGMINRKIVLQVVENRQFSVY